MEGPEWTVAMVVFAILVIAPIVAVAAVGIVEFVGPLGLAVTAGAAAGGAVVWFVRRAATPRA